MATDLENLVASKSKAISDLATLDSARDIGADVMIDGRSVSRTAARRELVDRIKMLNELIQAESPYEVHSQAV